MPSLTSHLLQLEPVRLLEATQHPFLEAAATSTLSPAHLKAWLAQDRLYAMSYVNFIGTMLSRIPVPGSSERDSTLEWRIADFLIDALVNIKRELKLFEEGYMGKVWWQHVCLHCRWHSTVVSCARPSAPAQEGCGLLVFRCRRCWRGLC